MIRRARRADIPRLMELWQAAFGDSREYISFFFQHRFSPQDTFLHEEEGRPVSAFYLLDARLCGAEAAYTVKYLYAACTDAAFRGQGLMRSLIECAARALAESGVDCIALAPASQGLFHYYAGCGFQSAFFCETARLSQPELERAAAGCFAPVHSLTPPEMAQMRRAALQGLAYLAWDEAALQYALAEHRLSGGSAIAVRLSEGELGYCLFRLESGACFAQEFLAGTGSAASALFAQLYRLGAREIVLRRPAGMPPRFGRAERLACGMLRPLSPGAARLPQTLHNAYLGLSLG